MRVLPRQPVGELPGPVGRRVVDDQNRVVGRHARQAVSARRARAARGCRARHRSAGRPTRSRDRRSPASRQYRASMFCGMTNAEIAAAMDELADLYELDGAVIYRVVAYREAAKSIRDSPVSVAQLAREGRATELRNVGKTLEEKIRRPARDGRHPRRRKAAVQVPGRAGAVHAPPRPGRQDRAQDPRRAWHVHPRRAAGRRGAGAPARLCRASGRRPSRTSRARCPGSRRRGLPSGCCCRPCSRSARRSSSTCVPIPAADRVEIAGSARRMTDTCKDLDIIADGRRPGCAHASVHGDAAPGVGRVERGGRRPGCHPQWPADRFSGGRAGPVRQRASAPDRLQAAQRGAARVRGPPRDARERVRRRGGRVRHGAPLPDGGRRVRGARAALHRAGAARGARRARGRRSRHRCRSS